ncbi:MAG: MerR family transcriptional regulator [Dehalococcoidia bacterium]
MSFPIGEAARQSGLPVKTIRYYSDLGLLSAERSASGYRHYDETDLARLDLIRTLRSIGFDLATIGRLLRDEGEPGEVARLQLEAIDLQLRSLRRQRTLLVAALRHDDFVEALARARSVAALSRLEREAFLARHLERVFDGVAIDAGWKERFLRGAALDLPDDPDDIQLEAWLELADLVSDESFVAAMQELSQRSTAAERPVDGARFDAATTLLLEAAAAADAGQDPAQAGELLDRFVALHGEPSRATMEAIVAAADQHDPRAERYWELIAAIKRWETPSQGRGHRWLVAGLRARLG